MCCAPAACAVHARAAPADPYLPTCGLPSYNTSCCLAAPAASPERSDSEGEGEAGPPPPGYAAIPFSYGTSSIAGAEGEGEQSSAAQQRPGSYNAVGFSYGGPSPPAQAAAAAQEVQRQQAQGQAPGLPVPGPNEPPFVPGFVVPEHLRRCLPATERHFKVRPQGRMGSAAGGVGPSAAW